MRKSPATNGFSLAIEYYREEDGRWLADIPALPGVTAYGRTKNGATAADEALALRLIADRLDSQHLPGFGGEDQFEHHHGSAGVVPRMVVGMDDNGTMGDIFGPAELFGGAGHPHVEIEDLGDGSPHGAVVGAPRAAMHVAGGNPPLLVGGAGEGHGRLLASEEVAHLDGVACRIDMLPAGLKVFIHDDMAAGAECDA